ncbi:hypothetical protein C1I63_02725 [Rathayibacter caricis DSM 15933]|uniref:Uncharacterized protein n=1 Tax=Rathayibacter caricis DSM 15933 TaxID=1328867 RepID=A0A2T4UQQ4_9MICO|nr:hypothetical protein C1I63_02725 [Rathayibacter caricis DSM 15933]
MRYLIPPPLSPPVIDRQVPVQRSLEWLSSTRSGVVPGVKSGTITGAVVGVAVGVGVALGEAVGVLLTGGVVGVGVGVAGGVSLPSSNASMIRLAPVALVFFFPVYETFTVCTASGRPVLVNTGTWYLVVEEYRSTVSRSFPST